MRLRVLFAVLACVAAMAFAPAPFPKPDRKNDLQKLAGDWTVIRYEMSGRAMNIGATLKVKVEGEKWSFFRETNGKTTPSTAYSFKLDQKHDPRLIELTMANAGPAGSSKLMGIYRWEREQVQVVFHWEPKTGPKWPVGFDGADKRAYLMILKRDKR
jgi:uncharacterized protein (TIGR03067 family)